MLETNNNLLLSLPLSIRQKILLVAEHILLDQRESIYKPNEPINIIDFPNIGVMSVVRQPTNGSQIEIATIGSEGMVGIAATLTDSRVTADEAYCQIEGTSCRISAKEFLNLYAKHEEIQHMCRKYTAVLLDSASSSISCNGNHSISQRCAKWLLYCHDRARAGSFNLTQEFLSMMLSLSRTAVNAAAQNLRPLE